MFLSNNSKLILRHSKIFKTKKVFFLGNIQDDCPLYLSTINTKINLQKYHNYIYFKKKILKKINIYNNLLISEEMIKNCDTIIYYWPKNKSEAIFQLINLMSYIPIHTEIFIIGDNHSGVKSAPLIFKDWIQLKKVDSAKHAILISGSLEKKTTFILDTFFKTHIWNNLFIKSLPGVFGHKQIDLGSKFLVSTFSKNITGQVLDMGCGTGFLSASLLQIAPSVTMTLVDNHLTALTCSKMTLKSNKFKGEIIYSNLYENIFQKFNLIICNPPFHNDLNIDFNIIKSMIHHSKEYLKKNGELRFVTNSCFHYEFLLKQKFKKYFILKKTNKYKIYQAFLN